MGEPGVELSGRSDRLTGLVNNITISAPSIKYPIDNLRTIPAGWACEASCFSNNPQPDLAAGLGEIEIKTESLRYTACAGRDLIEDASFNLEQWLLQKVANGFRWTINDALIVGDGLGKPMGLLLPNSGIPVCETSPITQPGQLTWQDLVQLKYEIPVSWHASANFVMNQRTFALIMTMTDARGRAGLHDIANEFPDIAPGSTPVAFGNWKMAYTLVTRKATTMQIDPFSAGFCILYKWDARVGGAPTCPNAARLLRVR
jgi:HK97 family phage major capsid protein